MFSPNLLWNAHHDWVTLRFQFGHGFAVDTGALTAGDGAGRTTPVRPLPRAQRLANLGAYLGGQLGLWGLIAAPLLALPFYWCAAAPRPG